MARVAPNISADIELWRPIVRGMCTLVELRTVLTIDDLANMNEALDLYDALEALAAEDTRKRS